jgi:serine phosphatase RsbU (regulator of sigma subunit)
MNWYVTVYIATIFISIALMAFLAAYSWRHRELHGAAAFGALSLLGAWGALAEFLSMIAGAPGAAVLWYDARFITLSGIPVMWLVFSLQYSGRSAWITPKRIILLLVIPAITQVMVWTNGLHNLWLKSNVGFYPVGTFLIADTSQRVYGPWFIVHSIYGYASMGIGVVLLLNMAARLMRLYRSQAVALAAGTVVLTVGAAIPTFNLMPGLKVNPIMQGLGLAALIFAWSIFRYRFLDIVPVARDILIDSVADGMLVLDAHDRIVDVNHTMLSLLGEVLAAEGSSMPKGIIGLPVMEVFHPWREIAERFMEEMSNATELDVAIAGQVRVFSFKVTPLVGHDGATQGRLVLVSDITDRKRADNLIQARLRLIEFAVSHSTGELLQNAVDEVCAITDSPIGFYHFVEPDQVTLSLQAWSTRTEREFCTAKGKGMHYKLDEAGVWVDCVHQRRPVIHNDYASLPNRRGLPEGHARLVRELVVPIFRKDKIVAILGVGNKPQNYTDKDVEAVSYMADVAWEITRRKLAEEALLESEHALRERNLRMEHDLRIAQMAQKGMIQGIRPKCDRVAIDFRYKPMEKVGGDYFSFFTAEDQSLGFFIGDVSGHGIASALFIALLKAFTDRMFRLYGKDPSGYLKNLNGELVDYMTTYFVTGIYGVFDSCDSKGEVSLRFSNGGHTLPILARKGGGAAFTGTGGDIIGISNDVNYPVIEERLRTGDRLFVYTDGIPETINEQKEMIDFEEGMLDLFNRSQRETLSDTLDAVMEEVKRFRGSVPVLDDITLIGFEVA